MKCISFAGADQKRKPGILDGERVFDLSAGGIEDLEEFIRRGESGLELAREQIASGESEPLQSVRLLAPLYRPARIFGIGVNYVEHAAESKIQTTAVPTVFFKLPSSITGPDAAIVLPKISAQPDYEAELAVVIGKGGYKIAAEDWQEHVFGYTIVNDVSARDVQFATSQWSLGKSFPTFTPMGPWIVTRDAVPDPHALEIRLSIQGETLQSSNTSLLIHRIPALIAYLSSITPLEPGDVISTGTPPGVGMGRKPQRWLKPGEEVVIHIERIGELRNTTRAEA